MSFIKQQLLSVYQRCNIDVEKWLREKPKYG
jgi:hypothetical protein